MLLKRSGLESECSGFKSWLSHLLCVLMQVTELLQGSFTSLMTGVVIQPTLQGSVGSHEVMHTKDQAQGTAHGKL